MRILSVTLLFIGACCGKGTPAQDASSAPVVAPSPDRSALVPQTHPLYARVEGSDFKNQCSSDADCMVSGCSQEVCAAEEAMTTCEALDFPSRGGSCGCLSGECKWYGSASAPSPAPAPEPEPAHGARGKPCPAEGCPAGMQCAKYYGIAGPNGPAFTSCETPCKPKGPCPDGLKCVTIADGPGSVCR